MPPLHQFHKTVFTLSLLVRLKRTPYIYIDDVWCLRPYSENTASNVKWMPSIRRWSFQLRKYNQFTQIATPHKNYTRKTHNKQLRQVAFWFRVCVVIGDYFPFFLISNVRPLFLYSIVVCIRCSWLFFFLICIHAAQERKQCCTFSTSLFIGLSACFGILSVSHSLVYAIKSIENFVCISF